MKVPIYLSDLTSKKFDKISKLLSKQLPAQINGLAKSKEILSKILGYKDYHDLDICSKIREEATNSQKLDVALAIQNNIKGNPDILGIPDIVVIAKNLPLHTLSAFAEQITQLHSPLHPVIESSVTTMVRMALFHETSKRVFKQTHAFDIESMNDVLISSYFGNPGEKELLSKLAVNATSLTKGNSRSYDYVIDQLSEISRKSIKEVTRLISEIECQKAIEDSSLRALNDALQLPISYAFIKDYKLRTIEEARNNWSCNLWFPEKFKPWNYIERDVVTPDRIDFDPDEDNKLYIHLLKKLNNGHVLEYFAEPVHDSFYEGLRFHNWVAKVTNKKGIVVTQANGTAYKINEDTIGGDLIYTSDMYSDTDVENSKEFLNILRDEDMEYGETLSSVSLDGLGNVLFFVQGLQKNFIDDFSQEYSGAKILPDLIDFMSETFGCDPFVVYRTKPDNSMNEKYMPAPLLQKLQADSNKIRKSISKALNHNKYDSCGIYGGERVYSQMETMMMIHNLHNGRL